MISKVTQFKHSLNYEIDGHSKMPRKITTASEKLGRMLLKFIKNFMCMTRHTHLLIHHHAEKQVDFLSFNFDLTYNHSN